jgi:electron-transferring-flavoprotein dehydrogenase
MAIAKRDQLEVDIRLQQLAKEHQSPISVMAIDKGREIGDHLLSGAVMDPRGLDELLPSWRSDAPIEALVTSDALWYLTPNRRVLAPTLPPVMRNRGKYVLSVQKLGKWLGGIAVDLGAEVFASFAGQSLLLDGDRVVGVRTGDKGVDSHGQPKSNYEAGSDILAKIVILCEGARGSLTKDACGKAWSQHRSRSTSLRCRRQGAMAMPRRERAGRKRDSHAWLPASR